jgi:Fur family transcriptional regulator, stress-responsive regulator
MSSQSRSVRASARTEVSTDLLARLQQRNWRLTAQRRVIAEVLNGPHTHLTAEEVLGRARAKLPEVSLATVYNTVNELVALGEIAELTLRDGRKRYDPNTTESHHHLICTGCDKILDVVPLRLPSLPDHERHGFDIDTIAVTFRGRCPQCVDSDAAAEANPAQVGR